MKGFITAQRVERAEPDRQREHDIQAGLCESYDALALVVASGTGGVDNGIGGITDGGAAARRAVAVVQKAISGERPNDEAQVWAERVAGIDRILSRDRKMGEAAILVAAVTPGRYNRVVGASVGDLEAWIIAPPDVPQETAAQNLTRRQTPRPLAGSGAALPVAFETNWPDGTLLLATSALFQHATRADIIAAARHADLEQAAQRLLLLARPSAAPLSADIALLLCRRESKPEESGTGGSLLKSVGKLWNWGKK